ncbi:MAG: mismatch-specific DNA-glycosylase [Gammaproteobacteria bacterium]
MKLGTLPDYLKPGLDIVAIGLNPSLPSVHAGFYFANPRNRFWRALNASGLLQAPVEPGIEAMQRVFERDGIGFTDVVKRPTAGGSELRAADYRTWAPILKEKLEQFAPRIAWFQGKQACRNYFRYGEAMCVSLDWGLQPFSIGASRVFVTPNPSPANAAYALDELTDWMRRLAALRAQL